MVFIDDDADAYISDVNLFSDCIIVVLVAGTTSADDDVYSYENVVSFLVMFIVSLLLQSKEVMGTSLWLFFLIICR